jgi:NAD(P)-dependent dehydrogenase (short-subunit alcohol dehydrogenase family)
MSSKSTKNSKVILITGASSGIGFHAASELIRRGFIVYAVARRVDRLEELKKLGGFIGQCDVTKEEDLKSIVDRIIQEQKRIDFLWNNAGFALCGSVEDTALEDARYQFEVNLFGLARLTQLVTPHMRRQQSGCIINTSSMVGKVHMPLEAWYVASKHAVEGFSDCLRVELSPFGIDVVILEPGMIATEFPDVLSQPLVTRSTGGAYEAMAKSFLASYEGSIKKGEPSDPQVITDTIVKIVQAKKPKTRYLVGKFAKLSVFIRRWFGDTVYDMVLKSEIK